MLLWYFIWLDNLNQSYGLHGRRLCRGYWFWDVFMYIGGPICWNSTLQDTVALSIVDGEYMILETLDPTSDQLPILSQAK